MLLGKRRNPSKLGEGKSSPSLPFTKEHNDHVLYAISKHRPWVLLKTAYKNNFGKTYPVYTVYSFLICKLGISVIPHFVGCGKNSMIIHVKYFKQWLTHSKCSGNVSYGNLNFLLNIFTYFKHKRKSFYSDLCPTFRAKKFEFEFEFLTSKASCIFYTYLRPILELIIKELKNTLLSIKSYLKKNKDRWSKNSVLTERGTVLLI